MQDSRDSFTGNNSGDSYPGYPPGAPGHPPPPHSSYNNYPPPPGAAPGGPPGGPPAHPGNYRYPMQLVLNISLFATIPKFQLCFQV